MVFVNDILRPAIDTERSKVALKFGKKWKQNFKLIITFCDGEAARLSSVLSGLQVFEPAMLHLWRMKRLWQGYPSILKANINIDGSSSSSTYYKSNGSKLRTLDTDIEYLPFNELETYPSKPVSTLKDAMLIQIVNEMKEWKLEFDNCFKNPQNELTQFWVRKSFQLVLVIVAVIKNGHPKPKFFRGCNMEVSMPTGSLCAERNAIGSALANDLTIRREEFKMVAVFGMKGLDQKKVKSVNPLGPCGSCQEWLGKIAAVNPSFKVVTFSSLEMDEIYVRSLK